MLLIFIAYVTFKIDTAEALLFFSKEEYHFPWLCPQCQQATPLIHCEMSKNRCEPTLVLTQDFTCRSIPLQWKTYVDTLEDSRSTLGGKTPDNKSKVVLLR